jgi:hypothetical protein
MSLWPHAKLRRSAGFGDADFNDMLIDLFVM